MAYNDVVDAVIALIKGNDAIAAVVGGKVYLAAALQAVQPPFVVVEFVTRQREYRTMGQDSEGNLLRVRREVTVLLLKAAHTTAAGAMALGLLLDDLFDQETGATDFDVTDSTVTSSQLGDFTVGVDAEKAPDGSPVYVAVWEYVVSLTRAKPTT